MRRAPVCLCLVAMLGLASEAGAQASGGFKLSTPTRLELRRLQESWQGWTRAYFQDDEDEGRQALSRMLSTVESLGMERLPDQAAASAAFAVASAREGNFKRARWAVDCARQLDSGRSDPDFASAAVEWLAGNYLGSAVDSVKAYVKLLDHPLEGHIWRQNLGLSALYLLLCAGCLYLALLAAFRGAGLYHDISRLISPPLPRAAADAVTFVLLVWPVVLPSGLLWLALYWSILLWGYATMTQRGVLIFLWLVLGVSPAVSAFHQQRVREALLPPTRALENLAERRLYGTLFLDLEVLGDLMSDSSVVTELTADLYRDLRQWEHARVIYNKIIEENQGQPEAASAINNIGVFHHRRRDFGTAVTFFTDAAAADPDLIEAHHNLSRAYYEDFMFNEAHEALAKAKARNPDLVARWESPETGVQGEVIPTNGGLAKSAEIRQALAGAGQDENSKGPLSRAFLSLVVALAAAALAVGHHLARQRKGYPSSRFSDRSELAGNRWLGAMLPGWSSTRRGNGIGAFLNVLFVAVVVLLPMLHGMTYRTYLGRHAGIGMATTSSLAILVLFFAVRLVRAWRVH